MATKKKRGRKKHDLAEKLWSRCTPAEKKTFQARADKEGRDLSQHIRFTLQQYEFAAK